LSREQQQEKGRQWWAGLPPEEQAQIKARTIVGTYRRGINTLISKIEERVRAVEPWEDLLTADHRARLAALLRPAEDDDPGRVDDPGAVAK
jgi:hypothetical protein